MSAITGKATEFYCFDYSLPVTHASLQLQTAKSIDDEHNAARALYVFGAEKYLFFLQNLKGFKRTSAISNSIVKVQGLKDI